MFQVMQQSVMKSNFEKQHQVESHTSRHQLKKKRKVRLTKMYCTYFKYQ